MSALLLAYLGPETVLPISSAVAAIGGTLLLFGKTALRALAVTAATVFRRS